MRRTASCLVRTKRKTSATTAYKSVSEADIARAQTRGADVRRVWELQNVETKKLDDLKSLEAPEILKGKNDRDNNNQTQKDAILLFFFVCLLFHFV
jgi:hypothetical protein